jgi:hypothetical protein
MSIASVTGLSIEVSLWCGVGTLVLPACLHDRGKRCDEMRRRSGEDD